MVGLSDNNLKHRLLTEYSTKFTLEQAETIIATWEMAVTNTRALSNNEGIGLVASINHRHPLTGGRGAVIRRMHEMAEDFRRPVKSRLGVRPEMRPVEERYHYSSRPRFPSHTARRSQRVRPISEIE